MEKRKKVVLKIKEKLEVIQRLENGESVADISEKYGISQTTVRDIKKNKSNLFEFVTKADGNCSMNRKSMKKSKYEEVDVALLDWFIQQRNAGVLVSGPMCLRQAKFYHEAYGLEGRFSASSGWLSRFKRRHGICEIVEDTEQSSLQSPDCGDTTNELSTSTKKSHLRRTLAFDKRWDPLEIVKSNEDNVINSNIDDLGENMGCYESSITQFETKLIKMERKSDENVVTTSKSDDFLSNKDALVAIDKVLRYMRQCGFESKDVTFMEKIKDKIQTIGNVLGK